MKGFDNLQNFRLSHHRTNLGAAWALKVPSLTRNLMGTEMITGKERGENLRGKSCRVKEIMRIMKVKVSEKATHSLTTIGKEHVET